MRASNKYVNAFLAFLVALTGLIFVFRKESKTRAAPQVKTALIERRSFAVDVHTSGVLEAARTTVIASNIKGDQGKIIDLIADGASVESGQILARLDPTPFERKAQEVRSKILEAEAQNAACRAQLAWEEQQARQELRSLKYELKSAMLERKKIVEGDGPMESAKLKTALDKAENKFKDVSLYEKDLERLEKQGFLNPGERRQAEKKLAEERDAYEAAKLQYESYVGNVLPMQVQKADLQLKKIQVKYRDGMKASSYKIAKADQALNQSERTLEALKQQLDDALRDLAETELKAPFGGLAVLREEYRSGEKRKARVGDVVLKNQPILDLPDLSSMKVRTRVREVDLHKVSVGKRATVEIDAFPSLKLEGIVTQIGVLALSDLRRGSEEKYFDVMLQLAETDERLRPGMTSRLSIHSAEVTDSLTAPTQALFFDGAEPFVWVQERGGFQKRFVRLGNFNEKWAELKEGVSESAVVSLVEP